MNTHQAQAGGGSSDAAMNPAAPGTGKRFGLLWPPRSYLRLVGIGVLLFFASPFGCAGLELLGVGGDGGGDRYDRYKNGEGGFDGGHFALSPDGQTLVFSSPHSGRGDLYAVSLHRKTPLKRLTHSAHCDISPTFSPDGKQIMFVRQGFVHRAFGSSRGTSNNDSLFIMDAADGSRVRPLTVNAKYVVGYLDAAFSPDGKFVTTLRASHPPSSFLANETEWVRIDVATGQALPTKNHEDGGSGFAFSPDGKTVYFSASTGSVAEQTYHTNIYAAPAAAAAANDPTRRVCLVVDAYEPSVSPNGKSLAYVSYGGENQAIGRVQTDGKNARTLWSPTRHFPSYPQWEPSGKSLLFDETPDGQAGKITRLFIDTRKTETVVEYAADPAG